MTALWTVDAMAAAMRAERSGALPDGISGISIDSRSLTRGEAFFAIQGDARDGHDFVDNALKGGAGLAVVARSQRARFAAEVPLLIVDDVLEGLRDLARAARARFTGQVIAVTGSVGKTSTKELIAALIAPQRRVFANRANFNTEIGDRAEAIRSAIAALNKGDVLLIAGKGHETGQIVGDRVLHFSDHEAVAAALKELGA